MLDLFLTKSRGKSMVCVLETPTNSNDKETLILFCHGFVGHKITPHRMAPNLSRKLSELGYSVLRADCIGAGDSEGDASYMTIPGEVEDQYLAYIEVCKKKTWKKVIILGYSLGGTIASLLTKKIPSSALILWSPVSNPYWNIYHILGHDLFYKGLSGENVSIEGDYVDSNFFKGLIEINPLSCIKEYLNPIKIIHGSEDKDVLPINGINYSLSSCNSELHFVEGADHTYSNTVFQEELLDETITFVEKISNNI